MVARRFDWRRTTHAPNSPTAAHAIIALPIRNASSSISKVGVRTLRPCFRRSGHRGSERRVPPYHYGSGDPARAQKSRATVIQPTAPLRSRSALVARIDEVRASGAFHAVTGTSALWMPGLLVFFPSSRTAVHAIIALPTRNASSSISKAGVRTLRAYLRRSGHRGSERRVPPYHCGSGDPARAQKSRATVIQPTAPLRSRSALVARIDEVRASGAFHAVREHLPYGCPVCWYPFPSSRTAANAIIALPIRNASSLISKVGVCRFRTGVPGRPVPSRKKHPGITCV